MLCSRCGELGAMMPDPTRIPDGTDHVTPVVHFECMTLVEQDEAITAGGSEVISDGEVVTESR
jgi:hypothetical protein